MNGEYPWAQHDGLQVVPTNHLPIATPHDAPEHFVPPPPYVAQPAQPPAQPENAPELFVQAVRPEHPINWQNAHETSGHQHGAAADVPPNKLQKVDIKRHGSRRVLILGTIIVLVIIVAGMGTGLGYTLGRKRDSAGSLPVVNTTVQPTSTLSSNSPSDAKDPSTPSGSGGVVINNGARQDGGNAQGESNAQIGTIVVTGTIVATGTQAATGTKTPDGTTTVLGSAFVPTTVSNPLGQDVYLNDQLVTTRARSWFYTGKREAEVNQLCAQNNARITQIRIEDGTIPTFTVLMIENTGVYKSDWWWWFGPNSATQGTNRRLISIDPYYDANGVLQFAVVQVPNTGLQNRGWWWYFGITPSDIATLLTQNNARLVALRGYLYRGNVVYVVIMAENTGQDMIKSEWELQVTIDNIRSQLGRGFRLISLSRNPMKDWDAIFVTDTGNIWGWWYGLDYASAGRTTTENNLRMIDVSPYFLDGKRVFAMVETDNSR